MAQLTPRSRDGRARSVPTLPEEIWDMITAYTDGAEQKRLRLTCRTLSRIAAGHLFRTIYLEIQKDSIERMINVAFHDVLRYHVKQLVILESSQLVPFGTWREWYTHIENRADYPGGALVARSPWMMDEILELYQEYRTECLALSQFLFCIRSRSSGSRPLGERYYTEDLQDDNQMTYACDHFDEALANFKNLKTVQQRRWWQRTDPFFWRGLRFNVPDRRRRQVADREDDVLPLTFVLRGLGWAHSMGESNLKSLDIGTSGLAFWTEYGLRNNLWGALTKGKIGDIREELGLIRSSFNNLTQLRCSLSAEAFTVKTMLGSFAAFLGTAEMLEDLDLNFVERKGGEDIGEDWDLFAPLSTQGNRWKRLRRLKLSAYTGGQSLSTFLINQASSLRSLILYDCNLVTSEDSWPELFEQARGALTLDSIFLVNLFDAYPDKNADIKGYLIDYMDGCRIFHGFKDRIVDYILKKTDEQPVWDHKPIYDDHLSKCEECEANKALHDEASADEHSIFFEFDLLPIVADLGLL